MNQVMTGRDAYKLCYEELEKALEVGRRFCGGCCFSNSNMTLLIATSRVQEGVNKLFGNAGGVVGGD